MEVHLDCRDPQRHLLGVRLTLTPRSPQQRLQLPAWTPGSYLIRDYVRQLEGLEALQDGRSLPLRRLTPSSWQMNSNPQGGPITVRYRVMATELSVRTCHMDHQHAFLALAAVVLEVEGERWTPHRLQLQLPEGWGAFVPLPADPAGGWRAADFDQLVDTPVEAGPHREQLFSVAGIPHRWVTWGGAPGADAWLLERFPQLIRDVEQVCLQCCRLMGVERPASDGYLFVLHLLDEGYGGLEHNDSTVLVYGRQRLEQPQGYRRLLQLVAHEYLHQWNVRRLRPAQLSPIDYQQPSVVPTLWFAEGITSYVDQLLPLAAGLSDAEALLQDLGDDLSRYRLTPGRQVQSLRSSSEEAWVKLYRADAYAADSQVSYYLKGAVVALCLDLQLRRDGGCLPHVLQALWLSHGRWGRGYSETDLLTAFSAHSPALAHLLPLWLEGLDDPDLDSYLCDVGLRLEVEMATAAFAGLTLSGAEGSLVAQRVSRCGPAETAGVMVGDEILALDGQRLRQLAQWPQALRSGVPQELLISRRSQLQTLVLHCEPPAVERYRLVSMDGVTAQQAATRERWLHLAPEPLC
ncbi:MAG: M61 family metallopeptidase [Vulcanococcus sp.]